MKKAAGVDFGQLVIGPPGSGKTTYCEGMHQLLSTLGRPHLNINLDFANEWSLKDQFITQKKRHDLVKFDPPDIDVRDLIRVEDVMERKSLGPNGALVYCNNFLLKNYKWLKDKIASTKRGKGFRHSYLIIDMPGQVELYAHDDSIVKTLNAISNNHRTLRLTAVHLVDSTLCVQPHQYLSALLVTLSAQIALELPFVNVFSKVDLIEQENRYLEFPLEYFARAEDLNLLLPVAHPAISRSKDTKFIEKETKFAKFHEAICEVVEDFNLTSFLPLNIEDKEMTMSVLAAVDQSNGYAMSAYLPPALQLPGVGGDIEKRLPVDVAMRYHGSKWFGNVSDGTAHDCDHQSSSLET